jgi:hypothetical protein
VDLVGLLGHFLDEHVRAGDAVVAAVNMRFPRRLHATMTGKGVVSQG